jgi:hypothetical protein
MMKRPTHYRDSLLLAWLLSVSTPAADFSIGSFNPRGEITWSNAAIIGVVSLLTTTNPAGPWSPQDNYFTTNAEGGAWLEPASSNLFCRLLSADLSTNSPQHFTNLLNSYGLLETIAGTNLPGGGVDSSNYWRTTCENGWATQACLSRPHIAFADPDNNLLIVDQGSDSVLKVTANGRIRTFAGTHTRGFNTLEGWATNVHLNLPNGGWMREDGVFYILDTENNLIRRVNTHGYLTTLVTNADTGHDGRGLWVKRDESAAYWCALTKLRKWTPAGGVVTLTNVFSDLANIVGNETTGDLFICDRGLNRIFRLSTNGVLSTFAGNGTTSPRTDGTPVLQFGFNKPRDLCFLPNGGYFICEHHPGNCVWYIDPEGKVHRWLNGNGTNNAYVGDNRWFYASPATATISKPRSIVTDRRGNLIIVENDIGFVRRINFRRMNP